MRQVQRQPLLTTAHGETKAGQCSQAKHSSTNTISFSYESIDDQNTDLADSVYGSTSGKYSELASHLVPFINVGIRAQLITHQNI